MSAWGNSWGLAWGNSWGFVLDPAVALSAKQIVPVSFTTAGLHQLVAGVDGVSIEVLLYVLVASGTVTATFRSGTTTLTGPMTMVNGRPLKSKVTGRLRKPTNMPPDACALSTGVGKALNLALSAAVAVNGFVVVQRTSKI